MKRLFDVILAAVGLLALAPLLALIALITRWGSPGPAFFRQERIGRGFRPFQILKFRTMVPDAPKLGGPITIGDDPRITRVGRILRKTKLDELPQLINVLRGDMSFVGPRPEARKYVEFYQKEYEEILRVRPGITDLASIKYRDEAAVLGTAENPEEEYVRRVLPEKMEFARQYVRQQSLWLDLKIILLTLLQLSSDRLAAPRRAGHEAAAPR